MCKSFLTTVPQYQFYRVGSVSQFLDSVKAITCNCLYIHGKLFVHVYILMITYDTIVCA